MIYFAVDEPRVSLMANYLAGERGRPLRDRIHQITYAELFRTGSLRRGAWIFSALDALSDAELWMVHHLQSAARDAGLPVLNAARDALHRYELLQSLNQSGRNDFRAHRADGPLDTIRFPVFVRLADEHTGSLTPLLYDRAALQRAFAYLWLRRLPLRHLLVTEFCETASADGFYRKYSIFRIGDAYIPRHLLIGRHWMTKGETRETDETLISEEMTYLRENPHAAWAREVFQTAHIEYGRLDYGVRNGRPQAWEINFTPVLAGDPHPTGAAPGERLTHPAKERSNAAMREAFERIDPGSMKGDEVRVEFPSGLEKQARHERGSIQSLERSQRRIGRIATITGLRAVGPLLRRAFGG
jgi:hypothetical protein